MYRRSRVEHLQKFTVLAKLIGYTLNSRSWPACPEVTQYQRERRVLIFKSFLFVLASERNGLTVGHYCPYTLEILQTIATLAAVPMNCSLFLSNTIRCYRSFLVDTIRQTTNHPFDYLCKLTLLVLRRHRRLR